jgi:hypothetical protein
MRPVNTYGRVRITSAGAPSRASRHSHGSGREDSVAQCRNNQQHAATKENDQGDLYSNEKEGLQISVASNKNNFEPAADAEHRADNKCQQQTTRIREAP